MNKNIKAMVKKLESEIWYDLKNLEVYDTNKNELSSDEFDETKIMIIRFEYVDLWVEIDLTSFTPLYIDNVENKTFEEKVFALRNIGKIITIIGTYVRKINFSDEVRRMWQWRITRKPKH